MSARQAAGGRRQAAGEGEGDLFSTRAVTVSDRLTSRKTFKFNDIPVQKIIEWE
jgi:hypothetical protein